MPLPSLSRRGWILGGLASLTQAQDSAVFSTSVKVVNLLATVRTKRGEIVRDLAKEDFDLAENGHPQQIRYFSRETDLPLTIGLLIDTSVSQQKVLEAERGASFRFLDAMLRPQDRVFLVQFDMAVMIRQKLTSSRRDLEEVLRFIDTPTRNELTMQRGGGTLLYDAVVKAAEITKGQANRKALILLTDGVDTGSDLTLRDAIEAAQKSDTLICSILYADAGYYGGAENGSGVLRKLSSETGGSYYEVSRKLSVNQIYAIIQDELRSQYSVGYVSDEPVRVSEFRKVQLSVRRPGLAVQTRTRYWAQR